MRAIVYYVPAFMNNKKNSATEILRALAHTYLSPLMFLRLTSFALLMQYSIYTTRHRVQPAGPETYQSQAIMFLKEMIKRAIEKRLCDYNDETEWRRRSGLEPLPPPSGTDNSDPKPEEQTGTGTTKQNSAVNGGIVKEKSAGPGSSSGGGGDERPRKKAKLNHFAPATSSADDDVAANVIDLVEDSDCD